MKTAPSTVCLCALLLAAISCTQNDHLLRSEVAKYLHLETEWAPVEAETARTIDRILATHFVDESEVRRQVAADSPRITAHLIGIAAYTFRSPEVAALHAQYTASWRHLLEGYRRIDHGIHMASAPDIAMGRRALEGWRRSILDVARELRRLRDEPHMP
jgi:hypothetical protein